MAEKRHVLVTGGAGYLGSILVPALLDAGFAVTVLDNFMFRQNSLAAVCAHRDFEVVNGDVREVEILRRLVRQADIVIPMAALVGAPLCDKDRAGAISTNRDAIRTLVGLMGKDQSMLIPITNSGYGIGEEGNQLCTEDSPLRPISLYGQTKVEAEAIALERENTLSFRLATVFGMSPRMRLDLLVNDFVYRAVYDRTVVLFEGNFKRNFIHVRDVARGFLHGIENFPTMRGSPYNVGLSDANFSKIELCENIKEHLPEFTFMESEIGKDLDQRNYIVSNAKIEATGFKPTDTLDSGIEELIKGYRMLRNSVYSNV